MTQQNSSNQRVTMAILGEKMDHVIEGQKEIKGGMKLNTEYRIAGKERWKQHDREHASQRTKSWAGDIGAAIVGAGAAVGAFLSKQ